MKAWLTVGVMFSKYWMYVKCVYVCVYPDTLSNESNSKIVFPLLCEIPEY